MKRIPALFLIVSILVIGFISCKKDSTDNSNSNNNNNNTTSDSNYVDRIYIIDSTAAGEDTSQFEVYQYDNLKRVTYILDTTLLSGSPELFAKKVFEYNGNDSLPFKSTLYIFDGPNNDTITIYFSFDNTGRLTKDSIINISRSVSYQIQQQVTNISYAPGMIYGYTRDSTMFVNGVPSTNPPYITTDTSTLDANGNTVYSVNRRGASSVTVTTQSFDNHPHPFRRLNIYHCWGKEIFPNYYADPTLPNTNNITHVQEIATGGPNYSHDFDLLNSYYSNGSLKTTAHPESAGSPDYEKYLFVYKSL